MKFIVSLDRTARNVIIFILLLGMSSLSEAQNKNEKFISLSFLNKDFGILITSSQKIFRTTDGGRNWSIGSMPVSEVPLKVVLVSPKTGWIITDSSLVKTTDGGLSWKKATSFPGNKLIDIDFLNDTTGFISGSDSSEDGFILKTSNSGISWRRVFRDSLYGFYQPGQSIVKDMSFYKDSLGIAVNSIFSFKTTDNGESWSKLPPTTRSVYGAGSFINTFIVSKDTFFLNAMVGQTVAEAALFYTFDGGNIWPEYRFPSSINWFYKFNRVYFKTFNECWISSDRKITVHTSNGGSTWDTLGVYLEDFDFVSGYSSWGFSNGQILFTNDGWKTYEVKGVITSTDRPNVQRPDFRLYQNYPNPFNPSTTISYSIPEQSFVEIKVYDMLGHEVSTLVSKEQGVGEYKVEFNGSDLPSGMYIYTIRAGEFVDAKKLLFLK